MDKKMVPMDKLSKKAKRRAAANKRVTWAFSPVSRVKQSKKRYRRTDARQRLQDLE